MAADTKTAKEKDHSFTNPPIGVQLWSVKNELANDFEIALQTVASIGYSHVEVAGYDMLTRTILGKKPIELRHLLQENGLQVIGGHAVFDEKDASMVFDDFAALGVSYLICPSLPEEKRSTIAGYYEMADAFNKIGEKALIRNIQFGYHNHGFEFEEKEGKQPFEILLNHTDRKNVVFEIDFAWIVSAGKNPVDYFIHHPGRFPLWHIRDVDAGGQSGIVGAGIIDFAEIFLKRNEAGFSCAIVETPSKAVNGMEMIRVSYSYILANQFY